MRHLCPYVCMHLCLHLCVHCICVYTCVRACVWFELAKSTLLQFTPVHGNVPFCHRHYIKHIIMTISTFQAIRLGRMEGTHCCSRVLCRCATEQMEIGGAHLMGTGEAMCRCAAEMGVVRFIQFYFWLDIFIIIGR